MPGLRGGGRNAAGRMSEVFDVRPNGTLSPLWPRLPETAHRYVRELLESRPVEVRLTAPRRTKLGDHRPPMASFRRHRITVNGDLNPYALLTTLLHEIAHAATWERHRGRRRLRPHGREWKEEFERILTPVILRGMLPDDIASALARSLSNPAAATCSDRGLMLALARYDTADPGLEFVESLPPGTVFRTDGGLIFRLGPKARTRYRCLEQRTGREYRMHPLCRVRRVVDRDVS